MNDQKPSTPRISVSFSLKVEDPVVLYNFLSIGRPGRVCLIILEGGVYGDRQIRSLLQLEPRRVLYTKTRVSDVPEEGAYIYLFSVQGDHPVRLEHIEALWPQVTHAAGGIDNLEVLSTPNTSPENT